MKDDSIDTYSTPIKLATIAYIKHHCFKLKIQSTAFILIITIIRTYSYVLEYMWTAHNSCRALCWLSECKVPVVLIIVSIVLSFTTEMSCKNYQSESNVTGWHNFIAHCVLRGSGRGYVPRRLGECSSYGYGLPSRCSHQYRTKTRHGTRGWANSRRRKQSCSKTVSKPTRTATTSLTNPESLQYLFITLVY